MGVKLLLMLCLSAGLISADNANETTDQSGTTDHVTLGVTDQSQSTNQVTLAVTDQSTLADRTTIPPKPLAQPGTSTGQDHSDYPYHAALDQAGSFQLWWKFDDETITFQVHAVSKGWAGIGFSPNGGMGGADLVVFWVDQNGKAMISDRHATHNGFPPADEKQDYELISGTKNETHIIATFSRKRITCDPNDWPLTDDTTRVIYAANDAMPEGPDSFHKHTVRGAKSVHFFDKKEVNDGNAQRDEAGVQPLEFRVNKVHIPDNVSTTYWCEVLLLPKMTQKMHIIKAEPVIDAENTDVVHHIIVYVCSKNVSQYVGYGAPCFGQDADDEEGGGAEGFSSCRQQVLAVWAVGGQATTYPDFLGMPLYNDASDMYVMMEMHYDNSQFKSGKVDSSGMRVWITEKLRSVEGGQATFGMPVSAADLMIPPGQKEFITYGYCTASCTAGFPKDGVKVLGGLLHTHLAGRKVRLLHFRNGKQLPAVLNDEYYDFNYQDTRRLTEPVTILPGDELVVECVYQTLDRNQTVFGGPATHDEMCLIFVEYYPATFRSFGCISAVDKREIAKVLGIELAPFNASEPLDTSVMLPNGEKKKLSKYLKRDFKFDWTTDRVSQYQKAIRNVRHDIYCVREDRDKPPMNFTKDANGTIEGFDFYEQYGYPNVTEPLVIRDICNEKKETVMKSKEMNNENQVNRPVAQPLHEYRDGAASSRCGTMTVMMIAILGALYFY